MNADATMSVAARNGERSVLLLIAGVIAFVAVIYAESVASMARYWQYSEHQHGLIVVPVCAYLLWRLRGTLARAQLGPWPPGVAMLAACVVVWLVGRGVGVQAAEHVAIALLIPVAVATCLGLDLTRRALFPLLFLLAAVPLGDALIPYLMVLTADVSAALLRMAGVPVFREGQFLSLPGGEFEVADVCSGLRYLVAGTVIALLYAYLTYESLRKRALFVVGTAIALMVMNGVRAFIVMFVASATDMRVFAGDDHIYFGWVLFAAVVAAIFWVGARYADSRVDDSGEGMPATAGRDLRGLPLVIVLGLVMLAITARPLQAGFGGAWVLLVPAGGLLLWIASRRFVGVAAEPGVAAVPNAYRTRSSAVVVVAAAAVLVAGPALVARALQSEGAAFRLALPALEGCTAAPVSPSGWQPEIAVPPSVTAVGTYECAGSRVNVFAAGYAGNLQGQELVSAANLWVPESWRRFAQEREHRAAAENGQSLVVNEVRVDGGGRRSLIWYWFSVGERTATKPVVVKALQAVQFLLGAGSDGVVYWLETPLDASVDRSRARLEPLAAKLAAGEARVPAERGGGA